MRARGARTRTGRPALHHEDRLAPCNATRDPCEAARVAERLEVQHHEVGAGIVLPPLEQVVRRHVGLVPDRDERREPQPAGVGALEDGEAERTALRREADPARRERPRREGGVQSGGGRRDAEAVGADQTRAVGAHEGEQPLLSLDPLRAGLREARGDHAERADAVLERLPRGVEDARCGQADDGEVEVVVDLGERAAAADACDRIARAVHGVGATVEPGIEDVAEELAADRPPSRRRTHHDEGSRREERTQRRDDADVVACVHALAGRIGCGDPQPHLDHASLERTP